VLATACGTPTTSTTSHKVQVVAAENFWGSIASQLGGEHITVTNIINNPDADPHDYEATPADARTIASANYVIFNGAGYDPWVRQLLDANPVNGRQELEIGKLVGKQEGDNPHLWYNPDYVTQVANQITTDLKRLDAADATYFDQHHQQFLTTGLKTYHDLIDTIKQQYQGTPVGATESIFAYLAPALGLHLITPPAFMTAISEGTEPTAADKATFDEQITQKQIKILVYNKQNATPDTEALKTKAQQVGIPIVAITETLDPATASFQEWQSAQLQALEQALAQATNQ
jgi:zinc/manganese transport system substrate-binding protein